MKRSVSYYRCDECGKDAVGPDYSPNSGGGRGKLKYGTPCARCGNYSGEHWDGKEWLCTKHYAEVVGERGFQKYIKRKKLMRELRDKMGIVNIQKISKVKMRRYQMLLLQAGYEGPPRQKWGTLTGKKHGKGVHYGREKTSMGAVSRGT